MNRGERSDIPALDGTLCGTGPGRISRQTLGRGLAPQGTGSAGRGA